jgi:dTDP-4-dehydrorhamnose 3,5-epimerase
VNRLPTRLDGPILLESRVIGDERGFFCETFRADAYAALGVEVGFVQDNHSRSTRGVLRGMHFAVGAGQAKLVRVARGAIFDVVVDLRRGSPTFGEWEGHDLDDVHGRQLFVPVGFAHGFVVRSEVADVVYKCSAYYDGALERTLSYSDPAIGIEWPADEPLVSARDREAPLLAEIADDLPFAYREP